MKTRVEICVETSSFAQAAVLAGADRLEVCDRLDLDGLTPQKSVVEAALDSDASVVVMLRNRTDFLVGPNGGQALLAGLDDFAKLGVDGVVFGFLDERGCLDVESNRCILEAAKSYGLEAVFHRAIDVAANGLQAAAQLGELGFDRVLSAGGASSIEAGFEQFLQMRSQAPGLNWMPGGGIRADNLERVIEALRPTDIHASADGDPDEVERLVGLCRSLRRFDKDS
ncbi:MAG: hypothetical protein CMJ28_05110 [Phycisphaerae bacterium]|nr:hypothetical protein [Phycisphaerae bacterium]